MAFIQDEGYLVPKELLLRFNSSGDKAKELPSSKVELETKLSSLYSAPDDERGMTWGALRSHFPEEFAVAESKSSQERDGEEEWEKKSLGGGVVEIDDCYIAESTPFEEERRAFFYFFFFIVREEVLAAIDLDSACEQKQ